MNKAIIDVTDEVDESTIDCVEDLAHKYIIKMGLAKNISEIDELIASGDIEYSTSITIEIIPHFDGSEES